MRTFLAVLLSAFVLTSSMASSVARADDSAGTDSIADLESAGKRQRIEGAVVSAFGVFMLVGGVTLAIVGRPVNACETCQQPAALRDAGIALAPLGLITGGVGVLLWSRGERKIAAAEKARKAALKLKVELAPAPSGSLGAGLGLRFE
jgi:hypothetical protein